MSVGKLVAEKLANSYRKLCYRHVGKVGSGLDYESAKYGPRLESAI